MQLHPMAYEREAQRLRALARRVANLGGPEAERLAKRYAKQAHRAERVAKSRLDS